MNCFEHSFRQSVYIWTLCVCEDSSMGCCLYVNKCFFLCVYDDRSYIRAYEHEFFFGKDRKDESF